METINNTPINKPQLSFSSLCSLMRCPRNFYWSREKNIISAGDKSAMINGKAYHEAKAVYLRSKMLGHSHNECKDLGLKAMAPIMAEIKIEDKKRNMTVAFSTMNKYFDFWEDEKYKTLEVEIKFVVDLINFVFVGVIDAYKESPIFGELIEETKTTSIVGNKWELRGKPNLQIDSYVAAMYINTGKMPAGGILDIIPVSETYKKPMRFLTFRTMSDVDNWIDNTQEWWITLTRYRDSGIYPQNTENCVPLMGFSCEYNQLCTMYPQPHKVKELDIPSEYKLNDKPAFLDV